MPVSRRLALVGAVVVLGLTACGSPEAGPSASTLPAPAVIEVAGAGGAGMGPAPAAGDAVANSEAGKMMLPAALTYEWAGQAVDLTSPVASWSFPVGTAPTVEQVAALAAAFGVSGDAVEIGADLGGGWSVGPNDGSAPSVTVTADAMQSWWYSPAWQTGTVVEPCSYYPPGDPAGDPTTADLPVCEEPQPPVGVPTGAEAEAATRELFAAIGIDASQYRFETWADEWGASTTAFLVLDGVRTNVSVSVGFGEQGAITWAGGFLATPQRSADYPRIGVEAAVERLNDQTAAWMTGVGPMVRGAVAISAAASSDAETVPAEPLATAPAEVPPSEGSTATVATPQDGGAAVPVSTDVVVDPLDCSDPAVSCPPVDTVALEPIVVTLTSVESSLEQVWAADGTVWLLPGYVFRSDDGTGAADAMEGMSVSVLAVEDQYLVQAEPAVLPEPVPEPMPVETMPVETIVPPPAETAPAGDPSVAPPRPVPGEPDLSGPDLAELGVVGLGVDEATERAAAQGWTLRVARVDGEDLALTMDLRSDRINVAVDAGLVTEVLFVG